jgi:surfeit locus 1 family protein
MELMRRTEKGIPMGRHAEVNLSNNHAQYIATWYECCITQAKLMRTGLGWESLRLSCLVCC